METNASEPLSSSHFFESTIHGDTLSKEGHDSVEGLPDQLSTSSSSNDRQGNTSFYDFATNHEFDIGKVWLWLQPVQTEPKFKYHQDQHRMHPNQTVVVHYMEINSCFLQKYCMDHQSFL